MAPFVAWGTRHLRHLCVVHQLDRMERANVGSSDAVRRKLGYAPTRMTHEARYEFPEVKQEARRDRNPSRDGVQA